MVYTAYSIYLLALAQRGQDGEKDTAQRMLDKMLEANGLTYADLGQEVREWEVFNFGGKKILKRLLNQIVVSVIGRERGCYTDRARKNSVLAEVTIAEKIEIELKYSLYKKALENELEETFLAFIHRHHIFNCDQSEPEEELQMSEEELEKMQRLAKKIMTIQHVDVRQALPESI
ncbi:hypothetical protein [Endozoicomonas sp. ALB115]|uniref:hypothetical protein n=1 Tax=Endozoicomonas sp. ALB115 TaxID=3403074 RepID=UPI003BB5451E